MLHICDKFAENVYIKFNSSRSVAMRIGSRYGEKCAAMQLSGKDILYVNGLKYLGVHVIAAKCLKFSVEHLRVKCYRTFNCIYSRSKAANSEMITVQLLESYCLPFMLYAAEAVSLSSANCRALDNCINRALYRIFGPCDNMDCLRSCVGLDNVKVLSERKYSRFIDGLIGDTRYFNLLLAHVSHIT